jgi:hypothetical protein
MLNGRFSILTIFPYHSHAQFYHCTVLYMAHHISNFIVCWSDHCRTCQETKEKQEGLYILTLDG